MQMQLEPMTVGQILDRAFRLYSKNFVRFLAIVAVVQVPLFLFRMLISKYQFDQMVSTSQAGGEQSQFGNVMVVLLGGLLAMFAQALCNGALLKGISGAYLGEETSVGQAYRYVLPRLLSLTGAAIMVALVVSVGLVLLIVIYLIDSYLRR